METIHIYNQRLAIFANYLRSIKLEDQPRKGQYSHIPLANWVNGVVVHYEVRIHSWIFDSLPKLFPKDWYFNKELNAPCLKGLGQDENPVAGVFDWFQLNPEEFAHLMDLDSFQNPMFGGKFLTDNSETKIIAGNISDFIRWRSSHMRTD